MMQPCSGLPWTLCNQSGCRGIRLKESNRCLVHAGMKARKAALAGVAAGSPADLRGLVLDHKLQSELYDAAMTDGPPPRWVDLRLDCATIQATPLQWNSLFADGEFDGGTSFRWATFEQEMILSDAVFNGPVDSRNATFQRGADFSRARFMDGATFAGVQLAGQGLYRFDNVFFGGMVSFDDAQTTSAQRVSFAFIRCHGGAHFRGARFGEVGFSGASFREDARFDDAQFARPPRFDAATFRGDASFYKAVFSEGDPFTAEAFRTPRRLHPAAIWVREPVDTPPTPPEPPATRSWRPAGLPDIDPQSWSYAVVEEWLEGRHEIDDDGVSRLVGGFVTLEVSPWPRVDAHGRLVFPLEDGGTSTTSPAAPGGSLILQAQALQAFLAEARVPGHEDRPRDAAVAVRRPLRLGDAFAMRIRPWVWASRAFSKKFGIDQIRDAVEPQVYDVTLAARDAAKIALFATLAPPLDAETHADLVAALEAPEEEAEPEAEGG
jgi:Pentapeptide repeats (9 copies)